MVQKIKFEVHISQNIVKSNTKLKSIKYNKFFGLATPSLLSNVYLFIVTSSRLCDFFFNAKQASTEIIQNNYISSLKEGRFWSTVNLKGFQHPGCPLTMCLVVLIIRTRLPFIFYHDSVALFWKVLKIIQRLLKWSGIFGVIVELVNGPLRGENCEHLENDTDRYWTGNKKKWRNSYERKILLLNLLVCIRMVKSLKLKKNNWRRKTTMVYRFIGLLSLSLYKRMWFAEIGRNVGESRVYVLRFMRNHGPGGRSVP